MTSNFRNGMKIVSNARPYLILTIELVLVGVIEVYEPWLFSLVDPGEQKNASNDKPRCTRRWIKVRFAARQHQKMLGIAGGSGYVSTRPKEVVIGPAAGAKPEWCHVALDAWLC